MSPSKYFSDDSDEDEDILKAKAEGYKAAIMDMYHNIDMVAELCNIFPATDRLEMFLAIIKEL